jgi:hypothetical protein
MVRMRWLHACWIVALATGCATATYAERDGGGDDEVDARTTPIDARIDAPIDAPSLVTVTLSQTASMTITPLNSVACVRTADAVTRENSFYRAFRLADFGVTRPFTPTMVSFGVEQADAAGVATTQPVQVRLHTLSGAMIRANLTAVAGNNVTVPDSATGTIVNVPISPAPVIPPTATVVAEIFVPDSDLVGHKFFPGSNTGTETQPGYVRGPTCNIPEPATYNSLNFPAVKLVLTVTGTY